MAAELTAKKNLTVRMLSQNTQSAAVAAHDALERDTERAPDARA